MKLLVSNFFFNKKYLDLKIFIFIFLIWNSFKLFLINSDPIIQLLSALLSIGIYFDIEDKDLKIDLKRKSRFNFFGLLLFLIIFIRSFYLDNVDDKFYYLLLPLGIFSLAFIGRPYLGSKFFKNIVIISLLLPLRRLFFFIANPILLFITKYFTWFVLFCLGQEPNLIERSIFIGSSELVISRGCGGTDNLYFVICAIIIYKIIFNLRNPNNQKVIYLITFFIPILMNVVRNSSLAFIITLQENYREKLFNFFHDSYGSLLFSLISLSIITYVYFKLLDEELNLND